MKTLWMLIRVFFNLVAQNKKLRQAKKLDKEGKIAERDAMVVPLVGNWARTMIAYTGKDTKVTVNGAENLPKDGVCVFIGNHQSYFDIPVLLGYVNTPKAFIAKAEILKVPVLSAWMKLMQCTFMVRNSPRQSLQAMNEAIENVKKGYSLVIFPEGHRSKGGPMLEFKPGSFKLAFKSGAPIVPFTIDGTYKLYEDHGIDSGEVSITLHPVIPTAGLSREEQAEIPAKVQQIVASALADKTIVKEEK